MKDEPISFECAKLAKEKGFDIKCDNNWVTEYGGVAYIAGKEKDPELSYYYNPAPTQSLLQRWLREVHKINVESNYMPNIDKYACLYILMTGKASAKLGFESYEEALEYGLIEVLKLI